MSKENESRNQSFPGSYLDEQSYIGRQNYGTQNYSISNVETVRKSSFGKTENHDQPALSSQASQQLISAIYKRNYEQVERLVRENTYYEAAGAILNVACYVNDKRVVEQLIREPQFRARINEAHQGHSLLHKAAIKGDVALAGLLIRYGIDVNLRNEYGQTALHIAALNAHREMYNLLIAAGASPDAKDFQQNSPKFLSDSVQSSPTSSKTYKSNLEEINNSLNQSLKLNKQQIENQLNLQNSQIELQRLNELTNIKNEKLELQHKIELTEQSILQLKAELQLSKIKESQNELRHQEDKQKYENVVSKYNQLLSQYDAQIKLENTKHIQQHTELQKICDDLQTKYNQALIQADQLSKKLHELESEVKENKSGINSPLQQQINHNMEMMASRSEQSQLQNSLRLMDIQLQEQTFKYKDLQNKYNVALQKHEEQIAQMQTQHENEQKKYSELKDQYNDLVHKYNAKITESNPNSPSSVIGVQSPKSITTLSQERNIEDQSIYEQNKQLVEEIKILQDQVSAANGQIKQLIFDKQKLETDMRINNNKEKINQLDVNQQDKNNQSDEKYINLLNEYEALKEEHIKTIDQCNQLIKQIQEQPKLKQCFCSCGFVIILLTVLITICAVLMGPIKFPFGFERLDRGAEQILA